MAILRLSDGAVDADTELYTTCFTELATNSFGAGSMRLGRRGNFWMLLRPTPPWHRWTTTTTVSGPADAGHLLLTAPVDRVARDLRAPRCITRVRGVPPRLRWRRRDDAGVI